MRIEQQIAIVKRLIRSVDKIDHGEAGTEKHLDLAERRFELLSGIVGLIERLLGIGVAPRPARDDGEVDILASKAKDERAQRFASEPGIDEDRAADLTSA